MLRAAFAQYSQAGLHPLVEQFDVHYYNKLAAMCDEAAKQAARLHRLEPGENASHYITLCSKLIEDIQGFIKTRKEVFMPYFATLHEKSESGHNCSTCSGGCSLQHDLKLTELKHSQVVVRGLLHRLQMVALPLYSETLYPDAYRVLRNQMALIENSLTELHYVEEAYLIPKVTEAQTSINAGS